MSHANLSTLPLVGSIWSYRKHPDRLYEVVALANIAVQQPNQPPTVVYRSVDHPDHVFTREADAFAVQFACNEAVAHGPHKVLGGWEARQWISHPRGFLLTAPDGSTCEIEPEDTGPRSEMLRQLAQAIIVATDSPPERVHGQPHWIEDVADTIVRVDYQPTDGNEAHDSQFDGTYILYCICPARTMIEAVISRDHLQLDYADDRCTIFSVHHL